MLTRIVNRSRQVPIDLTKLLLIPTLKKLDSILLSCAVAGPGWAPCWMKCERGRYGKGRGLTSSSFSSPPCPDCRRPPPSCAPSPTSGACRFQLVRSLHHMHLTGWIWRLKFRKSPLKIFSLCIHLPLTPSYLSAQCNGIEETKIISVTVIGSPCILPLGTFAFCLATAPTI